MFARTKVSQKAGPYESLLGASLKVKGEIKSAGGLHLEGQVDGSVESQGDVSVGESAVVTANITAKAVTIAGTVEGNITCSGRVELLSTAKVVGNIVGGSLVVSEGASVLGEVKVTGEARGTSSKSTPVTPPERRH